MCNLLSGTRYAHLVAKYTSAFPRVLCEDLQRFGERVGWIPACFLDLIMTLSVGVMPLKLASFLPLILVSKRFFICNSIGIRCKQPVCTCFSVAVSKPIMGNLGWRKVSQFGCDS